VGTVGAGASATRYVFDASVNVFHAVGMACEGAGDPCDFILATVEETELPWLVDSREICELLDEIEEGEAVFQIVDGSSVVSVSCLVFAPRYSVTVIFATDVTVASAT
jgi:hypothetical protein